jgi:hypothetical protein
MPEFLFEQMRMPSFRKASEEEKKRSLPILIYLSYLIIFNKEKKFISQPPAKLAERTKIPGNVMKFDYYHHSRHHHFIHSI